MADKRELTDVWSRPHVGVDCPSPATVTPLLSARGLEVQGQGRRESKASGKLGVGQFN